MSDYDKEFGNKILNRIKDCLEKVSYLRDRIEFEHNGGLTPDPDRFKELSRVAEELMNVCQCWEAYARPYDKPQNGEEDDR